MIMGIISTFLALFTSLSFLSFSTTKPYYHSLFLSDFLTSSSNASIANHLYVLTRRLHVAGSEANAEAAAYVLSTLASHNMKSHIAYYDASLTYPVSRFLTLQSNTTASPIKFDLQQEIYNGDPYADVAREVLPTFHGYAKSGAAAGPVVYANYGRLKDYQVLREMKVNVSGKIWDDLQRRRSAECL